MHIKGGPFCKVLGGDELIPIEQMPSFLKDQGFEPEKVKFCLSNALTNPDFLGGNKK